jgi:hypothetical protein
MRTFAHWGISECRQFAVKANLLLLGPSVARSFGSSLITDWISGAAAEAAPVFYNDQKRTLARLPSKLTVPRFALQPKRLDDPESQRRSQNRVFLFQALALDHP